MPGQHRHTFALRVAGDLFVLACALTGWYLPALALAAGMLFFHPAYELVLVGVLVDAVFGSTTWHHLLGSYVFTSLYLGVSVLSYYIRTRFRSTKQNRL